jgi:competence protein ComEA
LRGPQLIVHIVGAVKRPGLYSLQNGARVIDAVLRAGGLSKNADDCGLNLARLAIDGEQIIVPTRYAGAGACVVEGASSANNGKPGTVSLSRASLGELDALPGIGPGLAQRIIDWRAAHGGFKSVTQLDDVSGIGPRLLEQLTPLVSP